MLVEFLVLSREVTNNRLSRRILIQEVPVVETQLGKAPDGANQSMLVAGRVLLNSHHLSNLTT